MGTATGMPMRRRMRMRICAPTVTPRGCSTWSDSWTGASYQIGFSDVCNSWEPRRNLPPAMVREYERRSGGSGGGSGGG
eukprot:1981419-Prymnesium_polylepis.1